MFQITFSEQSVRELAKMPTLEQLATLEPLTDLRLRQLEHPTEPLGSFKRGGALKYRLRSGDFRIYFERHADTLHVLCILHRNTLTDFIYRTKLPISEEQLVEQHSSFWKYLDTLKH